MVSISIVVSRGPIEGANETFKKLETVQKDLDWAKVGLKCMSKFGICSIAYAMKWLFTQHFKKVHKKAKINSPLIHERGSCHEDHVRMNTCILSDAHAIQSKNDQKVVAQAYMKAHVKWDHFQSLVKENFEVQKLTLVHLAFD